MLLLELSNFIVKSDTFKSDISLIYCPTALHLGNVTPPDDSQKRNHTTPAIYKNNEEKK